MKKIVTVIVTFNRKNKLMAAIDAYLKSNIFKIVVVNNASTDGTDSYLGFANQTLSFS
ncbi:glycosyltransferase [Acetonema longum]|uniref:Glycosyltransferase 2-like domain-containing protein n=1 Tax=Acetonema longum DSM 6540 TaxID=1009370 RepID=F7NLX9_9FIRM|nr:glycosyltransferase [Acetonema longum]EGO62905.1 hypothetical protein ALO_15527 [Acetonema longum DSM 6540]